MDNKDMEVVEHLEEFRRRLFIILGCFFIFLIFGFVYVKDIYKILTQSLPFKLTILGPSDILWIYFSISGIIALALTIPVASFQCWLFVRPGLHAHERKAALMYIPFLFILFVTGLLIGYFLLCQTYFVSSTILGKICSSKCTQSINILASSLILLFHLPFVLICPSFSCS